METALRDPSEEEDDPGPPLAPDGVPFRSAEELLAGVDEVCGSPDDGGTLELVVRRPSPGERESLQEAILDRTVGLVGDNWLTKGSSSTPDRKSHPDKQVTLMNCRAAQLVSGSPDRWALAGDQLYVDLALGYANLPPGTRLAVGSAVVEVTEPPHKGCGKFVARFGREAMRLFNSPLGRELNMRGINARVVVPGVVRLGDEIRKVLPAGD